MPVKEGTFLCSGLEVEVFDGNKDENGLAKVGFIKPLNGKWSFPKKFLTFDRKYYNFKSRSTDVIVEGAMKSGTTWVQEIVWAILKNGDLNHPHCHAAALVKVPWFELDIAHSMSKNAHETFAKFNGIEAKPDFIDMLDDLANPRVYKSHLLPTIINKNILNTTKIVYVIRNPLDSFYSNYLFHNYMHGMFNASGDLKEYTEKYITGEIFAGNAAEHIRSWWPHRELPNLYIIYYEDVIKDAAGAVRKLAKFLEKELSETQVENIVEITSFESMKKNSAKLETFLTKEKQVNADSNQGSFYRKGIIGDSKNLPNELHNKMVEYFNETLKDLDLPYKFELK